MRLLLDTHAFLWWLRDDRRLSLQARKAIGDHAAVVHVSAASIWEASIKVSLGKIRTLADLPDEIPANGFVELPVRSHHAWQAGRLPRHHGDPFDRLLVAQAMAEELTIVTRDPSFRTYQVPLMPA